ncbi:slit homolog 3 protein-like [Uloborus diversus]|uniref:slit homolog 3 protein-like n=1 Tax=Uloborus diversus TaxID=327109 RepID=UPI002409B58D|nr:slit homolog 3 protein-like [Uloborus diversus]
MLPSSITKLSVVLLMVCGLSTSCPAEEDIAPSCICEDRGNGPMMICFHIRSPDELIQPMKSAEPYDMFSLAISNSTLQYLPSELFHGMRFRSIRFMHTQLMSLSDSDVAFEGLENYLEKLQILEGHFVARWEWDQLRNLKKLELLDVNAISLTSIDEPFPELKTLEALGFVNADISFVVEKAFAKLENLRIFNMKGNSLKEIKRNILPNPAAKLLFLDFSGNKLEHLPDDMFKNMPNLVDVDLENNHFATLNEDTFSWPLNNLETLVLRGNPFKCDCRLRWLVDSSKPKSFSAKCASPEHLKERDLSRSYYKDAVWCDSTETG